MVLVNEKVESRSMTHSLLLSDVFGGTVNGTKSATNNQTAKQYFSTAALTFRPYIRDIFPTKILRETLCGPAFEMPLVL
jgi:hypothetical protein